MVRSYGSDLTSGIWMVGGKELEDTGRTEGGKGAVEWGKRPGGNEF